MNLTREYKTVRALFEKPSGALDYNYESTFGPFEDEEEESEELHYQTHFVVHPIAYYVELDVVDDTCYVSFGYFDMVGTNQELNQYFSRLYNREIDDAGLARLKNQFERDPSGILKLGNAGKVFGNVLAILGDFKSKHDFSCLQFSSTKESRNDLYRRMVKRFLPDWEVEERPTGSLIWFAACEPVSVYRPFE